MIMDLFSKVSYAFSDPSTAVVEAMQFGVNSFFLDMSTEHKSCIYREYPNLCICEPNDAPARIMAIESDVAVYPRNEFSDLIDCQPVVFHDVVRHDMGLEPKGPHFKAPIISAFDQVKGRREEIERQKGKRVYTD